MKHYVSRQRKPLRRTLVYSFMTIVVAIFVLILSLIVLGYSFNGEDGKIEQGGLLQLNSIPNGATVTLDGLKLGSETQTKTTVTSGNHNVTFEREGYRPWNKQINVGPGQIGWVNYARLIPYDLAPKTIRTLPNIAGLLASPGRNYMLINEDAAKPEFELVDVRSDTVRYTTLELPAGSYTPGAGKFSLVSWSKNENAALVKHIYGKGLTEWIVLDRENPDQSINITKMFNIAPDVLSFAGGGDEALYSQAKGVVSRIDVRAGTSEVLATKVAEFYPYDDRTIVYTTLPDATGQRVVRFSTVGMKQPIMIYTAQDKLPLRAAIATYFSDWYVVVTHGKALTVYTGILPSDGKDPKLTVLESRMLPGIPQSLSISDNNRFVTTKLADGFAVYDLELKKFDHTKWTLPAKSAKRKFLQPMHWLDSYILWADYGGKLRIYDFDGANQQEIMPVTEGLAAIVAPNEKYLYGLLKTDKGYELKQVLLQLP